VITKIGESIQEAKRFLLDGNVVAIPTETVYGLAGNALDPAAVLKIFVVKDRPTFDPLIVHICSIDQVEVYAHSIPTQAYELLHEFWPGPLTIVLPKSAIIPDIVTSGLDTVGLRMPNHPITIELLKQLDFPLAAPSANPFGYISPTSAQHVLDQLGGKLPYILDGGICDVGVESTIVGFENDQCLIYRLGGITVEAIRKVIPSAELQINSSSNPKAPGMLKSHYAPKKPFYLGDLLELSKKYEAKNIAALTFGKSTIPGSIKEFNLSAKGDFKEAAFNLFSILRLLDNDHSFDIIIASTLPDQDLGLAINDRLRRAASN
jgi:L-threonylcarbamoyladenylate synthase